MCTSLGQKHPDRSIKTQKKLELASIRLTWTVQSIKTRAHVQISTRTVHGKGQCADMCTNMVHQLSKISTRTVREKDQHADMCGQRADMCIDGQYSWAKITRASAESKDECADIQPTCAKITRTVHGKGQRADMCTD
ncbi:unnamed protein product, partial [Brassica oleracea]